MAAKRIHVFYSGRVQGVGFRYTAVSIASELGLTGWVRNLENGGVEAVCEGGEKNLKKFLKKIDEGLSNYIVKTDVEWEAAADEFEDFDIRW
jgi:acylphosphatase